MSRTPAGPRITLEFEKFSSFVEDYAANLSLSGMFLRTDDLRPVGSIVDFEINLADGFRLVEGTGEVAWVLSRDLGPDRPAGMAVRFRSLDDKGRELILKILEEQVRRGGESFDVDSVPEDVAAAAAGFAEHADGAGEAGEGPAARPPGAETPAAQPPGVESKILGEDGFTLLDEQGGPPARMFEQLEFDAPWGEQLPEIPREILDGEVVLPESETAPETAAAAGSAGAGIPWDDDAPGEAVEDLDDETFLLARQAADEVGSELGGEAASLELDGFDFDLSLDGDGQDADFEPDLAGTVVGHEDVFEMAPEEPLPEASAAEAPFADVADTRAPSPPAAGATDFAATPDAPAPEEEDLTVVGERRAEPGAGSPAIPDAAAAQPVAAAAPPVVAAAPPVVAAAPLAAAAAPPVPAPAVQDYEDDLFREDPETGAGQVLREALGRSPRTVAVAALLIAVAGAAWFFRQPLVELLGVASPEPAVTAARLPSVAEPSGAAPEAPVQTPAAAPGADVPAAEVPPVIEVAPEGASEDATATERESAPDAAARPESATGTAARAAPAESAAPPPSAEPPPAVAPARASPATRVDRISWRRDRGGTLVTIELDGRLADERLVHAPLAYSPVREMVEIVGIVEPYVSGRIEVGSPEVQQIRIGHHLKPAADELHVVFDFPRAGPHIEEVRSLGDRLEILVLP